MDIKFKTFYFLSYILTAVNADENQNDGFVVVSTSQRPSELEELKECRSRLETINSINATFFNYLEKTKLEIIKEIQQQLKDIIKEQMIETKKEIIAEIENRTLDNLTKKLNKIEIKIENTKVGKLEGVEDKGYYPNDCKEIKNKGNNVTGVYRIRPNPSGTNFLVWCDMITRDGGWTYVINRFDGSQNFYLNWTDYKDGFGKLSGEFWLGLEHLYQLTHNRRNELLFELEDWDSKKVYAIYDDFEIGNESQGYFIKTLGNYKGDAGDSFRIHYGQKFSTGDKDQEDNPIYNCAQYFQAAWWYNSLHCYEAHLTGKYVKNPHPEIYYSGAIHWFEFHDYEYSLQRAKMMIRSKN